MTTPTVRVLALAALLALVPAAASSADEAPADRARDLGEQAARALQKQLGGALMQALRAGGPAAAVGVCADTAQALTGRIAHELDAPGLELKRTSLHLRNPANRPDAREAAVLEDFTQALAAGEEPTPRLETGEDGAYRFFAPITTRGFCLQCHGPADRLAEGVPAILAERYPDDGATGHAEGDLRGIVSVTIPAAAVGD